MQHLAFILVQQKPRALCVQQCVVLPKVCCWDRKAPICLELLEGGKCLPSAANNLYGGELVQSCTSVYDMSLIMA